MKRVAIITCLLVIALGVALAQDAPENDEATEIAALDMHTYRLEWIRYQNLNADGKPKLTAEADGDFPYRRYNNGYTRIFIDDLDSTTISALIAQHEIAYDEGSIDGRCDPNKLDERSADIICIPGTRGFPRGNIFLALFDPQSLELVALTTTIDNTRWGALKASWQPTPTPAPLQSSPDSCGPYAAWEWILADEFVAVPGLPIVGEGGVVTIYQCVVRDDVSPYFQAHFAKGNGGAKASGSQAGGSQGGSGNGGSGGGGGDNPPGGGSPGSPNPGDNNDNNDDDDDFTLN